MSALDRLETERYEIAKRRCRDLEFDIENSLKIITDREKFVSECEKHHAIESEFIRLIEKKIGLSVKY